MAMNYQVSPEINPEEKDTFRVNYRELSEEDHDSIKAVKKTAQELYDVFAVILEPEVRPERARSINLAKTKLEESVMWAIKGITS